MNLTYLQGNAKADYALQTFIRSQEMVSDILELSCILDQQTDLRSESENKRKSWKSDHTYIKTAAVVNTVNDLCDPGNSTHFSEVV